MVGISIKSFSQVIDTKADLKSSSFKSDSKNSKHGTPRSKDSQNRELKQTALKNLIYIGHDWPIGKIVLRDDRVIDNYLLRYNLLADQLEFISGKDTLVFMNPQNINTATFGGHTFIYENYISENGNSQGYFELIVPGKNRLMLRRLVTNFKPDMKYPDDESITKYKVGEDYYISKPGVPAKEIKINRKSALTFLNGHTADISEYLRITGNKVRTVEDLKNLVSYYNSLDEEY